MYGWAALVLFFVLFMLADFVNLEVLQPFLMVLAGIDFLFLVGVYILQGRP
jgi:hypothetical protein